MIAVSATLQRRSQQERRAKLPISGLCSSPFLEDSHRSWWTNFMPVPLLPCEAAGDMLLDKCQRHKILSIFGNLLPGNRVRFRCPDGR